jgi:hypothetical protein
MGGGNLPDDSIAELDGCFVVSYLQHFAGTPFVCSGMANNVAAFDLHFSPPDQKNYWVIVQPMHFTDVLINWLATCCSCLPSCPYFVRKSLSEISTSF